MMPIKGHIYLLCLSNRSPILFIVNDCVEDYSYNSQVRRVKATPLSDYGGVRYGGYDVWLDNINLIVRINDPFERHFAIHYPHFESLTDITNASK